MFSVCGGKRWGRGYNQLKKLVLFFHKVGPGTWTQVSRLGSTCLYLLSHLICPKNISFADEQVIQKYQWWSEIRTSLCVHLQGPASSSLVPCPCHLQMLGAHISSATAKDTFSFSFFPFLFLVYVWGQCKLCGGARVCVCVYIHMCRPTMLSSRLSSQSYEYQCCNTHVHKQSPPAFPHLLMPSV